MTNLERWNYYLRDLESPQIYIDWTYYALISSVLSRKVCINGSPHKKLPNSIFANVFLIFVGDAGLGKSMAATHAMRTIRSFDSFTKDGRPTSLITLGPSSVTLEGLTRYMNNHYTTIKLTREQAGVEGSVYTFSSLALLRGEELGTLLKEDTHDLVTFLCEGWDCGDFHRETKTQGVDLITNMCITLLGACTPSWMRENMSSRILSEGFSARTLFVYAGTKRHLKFRMLFTQDQMQVYEDLRKHIKALAGLYGEVQIPPDVEAWCEEWYLKRNRPTNPDKRLKDYYARKRIWLYKTAMLIHFGESLSMTLTQRDFERALDLLAKTERDMHLALLGTGTNPIFALATNIRRYIHDHQTAKHKRILLEFYDEGDDEMIKAALQFLTDTGQISCSAASGELTYGLPSDSDTEEMSEEVELQQQPSSPDSLPAV